MSLGLLLKLWCLLVVVNVASTEILSIRGKPLIVKTFTYGGASFTFFPTQMSWPQAQRHCMSEGMQLAIPADDIAVGLRRYLIDSKITGTGTVFSPWLSGGGDGLGAARWSTFGGAVTPSDPVIAAHLIREYYEPMSSDECLTLEMETLAVRKESSEPYATSKCSRKQTVLCREGREIKKIELFNVVYATSTANIVSAPASSQVTPVTNNSDGPQEATRVITVSHETSTDWGKTVGGSVRVETTIQTGIPFIVKGRIKIGIEGRYDYTWGEITTDTNTDQIRASVTVPAKSRISVWVEYKKNIINIPYTASVKIHYVDGGFVIREAESGVFKGVNASEFHVMYGKTERL